MEIKIEKNTTFAELKQKTNGPDGYAANNYRIINCTFATRHTNHFLHSCNSRRSVSFLFSEKRKKWNTQTVF